MNLKVIALLACGLVLVLTNLTVLHRTLAPVAHPQSAGAPESAERCLSHFQTCLAVAPKGKRASLVTENIPSQNPVINTSSFTCPLDFSRLAASASPSESAPHLMPLDTRLQFVAEFTRVEGWTKPAVAFAIAVIAQEQRRERVHGSVGEIGVQYGQLFLSLALNAAKTERLWAIDVFDDQHLNIDGSGRGDPLIFQLNLNKFGLSADSVTVLQASSLNVDVDTFTKHGLGPVRLASIDGGHTVEAMEHDMRLLGCLLAPGGVLVVDGWLMAGWPGVTEAVFRVMSDPARPSAIAPFLQVGGKLFFTTPSHQTRYLSLLEAHPDLRPWQNILDAHISRRTVFGMRIVTMEVEPDPQQMLRAWTALLQTEGQTDGLTRPT